MGHVPGKRGVTASPLVALLLSCGLAPAVAYGATSITFGTPVRLPTFQSCGGYEPGMAIDGFGNIFVTAHKQNHCDAAALDPSAPDGVRAASWLWISSDGVNFSDLPGLTPVALDQVDFGDEGDVALDDAMHLYFVDTKVKEDSMTRWTAAGPGKSNVQFEYTPPALTASRGSATGWTRTTATSRPVRTRTVTSPGRRSLSPRAAICMHSGPIRSPGMIPLS